jgi:hypothetical protein
MLPVVKLGLTLREEHKARVFENRVLRIFVLKRDELVGWIKLYNEELHNLHSLLSIIRMMKSRKMRWSQHEWGIRGMHIGFWWEIQKERDY